MILHKKQYFLHPPEFHWVPSLQTSVRSKPLGNTAHLDISTAFFCLVYSLLQAALLVRLILCLTHSENTVKIYPCGHLLPELMPFNC